MVLWHSEQGLQLADVVAAAQKKIEWHHGGNVALGLTVLDLGVINSEHFPFNLTGYSLGDHLGTCTPTQSHVVALLIRFSWDMGWVERDLGILTGVSG